MSNENKIVQLYAGKEQSIDEVLDLTLKLRDDEELETIMVVAVSKSSAGRFHILSSRTKLFEKYALAGMVQAWATEHSLEVGGWDDP